MPDHDVRLPVEFDHVEPFADQVAQALGRCRMRNKDMSLARPFTAQPMPEQRVLFGMPLQINAEVDGHPVRTQMWIGLNVRRVFTIYFIELRDQMTRQKSQYEALVSWLRSDIYNFTFGGAEKVGYSPFFQFLERDGRNFVSIWLTAMVAQPIVPGHSEWTFWSNDVAMQTLSFMQTTWNAGLPLDPPFVPSPL